MSEFNIKSIHQMQLELSVRIECVWGNGYTVSREFEFTEDDEIINAVSEIWILNNFQEFINDIYPSYVCLPYTPERCHILNHIDYSLIDGYNNKYNLPINKLILTPTSISMLMRLLGDNHIQNISDYFNDDLLEQSTIIKYNNIEYAIDNIQNWEYNLYDSGIRFAIINGEPLIDYENNRKIQFIYHKNNKQYFLIVENKYL